MFKSAVSHRAESTPRLKLVPQTLTYFASSRDLQTNSPYQILNNNHQTLAGSTKARIPLANHQTPTGYVVDIILGTYHQVPTNSIMD